MASFIRKIQSKATINDHNELLRTILSLLDKKIDAKILDIGCNDGSKTTQFADRIGIQNYENVFGVDIIDNNILCSRKKGIRVTKCNIEEGLPFDNAFFDVVISNQVIEHMLDTDGFIESVKRVLKKGGYATIATENLSYFASIVGLIFGYQAFAQHVSDRYHVGNPFSSFAGKEILDKYSTHKRIFTVRGLPALFEKYGFVIEAIRGAGFAPLPSFFSRFDKLHSRFIMIKARKT